MPEYVVTYIALTRLRSAETVYRGPDGNATTVSTFI